MQILKDRILNEGKYLGSGILKVDSFINHQVDPVLMNEAGKEFARLFQDVGATKILTAEISGIAPAVYTGQHLGLPIVYARKRKPVTMPDQVLLMPGVGAQGGTVDQLGPAFGGRAAGVLVPVSRGIARAADPAAAAAGLRRELWATWRAVAPSSTP